MFDGGLFLVPSLFWSLAAAWLMIDLAARRQAEAVGDGWYVARSGAWGAPRGFRFAEVERARLKGGAYVRGQYIVLLEVETASGQQHTLPTMVLPHTAAVRAEVARQLLASRADLDPATRETLEVLVDAEADPLRTQTLASVATQPRLDGDGRVRWPQGTGLRLFRGVMLTAVGVIGLCLAVTRSGVFRDSVEVTHVLSFCVLPLAAGVVELWLLVRARRRELDEWRASQERAA